MRLPALNTFTVVLIGGSAQLVGGGDIDTRREYRNDPLCTVAHEAAANSILWWETATSLVLPMIESSDHLSQAAVFGKRTVLMPTATGEAKRLRLSSVLDGTVEAIKETTVAQPFQNADWLLSDYSLQAKRRLNPDLRCQLFVSTDSSIFTVDYDSQQLFEEFERFSEDGSVLIVPHTRLAERFLNAYSEWVNLARAPEVSAFLTQDGEADLAKAEPPVAAQATFEVTGIFTSNGWQNPTALEAARRLKKQRLDLNLGIWDLVNDDALRSSLLEQEPLDPASNEIADLPSEYEKRASEALDERKRSRMNSEAERDQQLSAISTILVADGWEQNELRNNAFTFTLATAPHMRETLLQFELYVNKGSAAVYLASDVEDIRDLLIAAVAESQVKLNDEYSSSEFDEVAHGSQIWNISKIRDLVDIAPRVVALRPAWEHELQYPIQRGRELEKQAEEAANMVTLRAGRGKDQLRLAIGDDEMAQVVINGLADPSPDVREQSLTLLESLADSELVTFTIYAIEDPNVRVRETAVRRLVRDEESLGLVSPTLLAVMQTDPKERVRRIAASTYFQEVPDSYRPVLETALSDQDGSVVAAALDTLRWIEDSASVVPPDQILQLAEHPSEEVRRAAASVIGQQRSPKAQAVLKALTSDASTRVREAALEGLTEFARERNGAKQRTSQSTPVTEIRMVAPGHAELHMPIIDDLLPLLEGYTAVVETTQAGLASIKVRDRKSADQASTLIASGSERLAVISRSIQEAVTAIERDGSTELHGRLLETLTTLGAKVEGSQKNFAEQIEKLAVLFPEPSSSRSATENPPPPPPGAKANQYTPPPPKPKAG